MTTLMPGRSARMSSISVQNCRRESGSTPVVGSSRMSRSGSWTSAPHSPTFCFMPPESLPAGRSGNGPSPVASSSSLTRVWRSVGRQPEELRHEVDVVADAELQIEVLAQALRHVRDPRAHGAPMPHVGDVAVQDGDLALLHLLGSGDQRHQRRLADAVGAHDADHDAAGNVERDAVERDDLAVAMGDVSMETTGSPARSGSETRMTPWVRSPTVTRLVGCRLGRHEVLQPRRPDGGVA